MCCAHHCVVAAAAAAAAAVCAQFLSVCHNFLTALPSGLSCLTALEDLDVSLNTDMRELPTGLGQLAKLTRLTASHMRLKQLPLDVGGLVSLVHLDVSHNSLHHLSPALSCLTGLTHLEASDNKLHQSAAVPEELASLTALRVRTVTAICCCMQALMSAYCVVACLWCTVPHSISCAHRIS
jgi:hypothetical protein